MKLLQGKEFIEWREIFIKHKKKDDLADSYLQGIWYFIHHHLVNIPNIN